MSAPGERGSPQSDLNVWLAGIRPRTLSMAVVPVLVGATLAIAQGADGDWLVLIVTLLCAVLIQVGTNLFNDAADGERGADGPERHGPLRITGSGLASPNRVRFAALTSFAAAFAGGIYLVSVGGLPILAIGLGSLAAGYAYSAGPMPLSHTAFGEVFVVAFFGVAAVAGSCHLHGGLVGLDVLVAGLAVGSYAAAVLLVNNVRDMDNDRRVGRRTLAGKLGLSNSRALYALLMLLPVPVFALVFGAADIGLAWIGIPLGAWLSWRLLLTPPGRGMNLILSRTAQSQVVVGTLFCAGVLL